jgi:hypothetical protein
MNTIANPSREFGSSADVQKIFGIKRGSLYGLIKSGKIESFCIKNQGEKRGQRLIDLDSVRKLILSSDSAN